MSANEVKHLPMIRISKKMGTNYLYVNYIERILKYRNGIFFQAKMDSKEISSHTPLWQSITHLLPRQRIVFE